MPGKSKILSEIMLLLPGRHLLRHELDQTSGRGVNAHDVLHIHNPRADLGGGSLKEHELLTTKLLGILLN